MGKEFIQVGSEFRPATVAAVAAALIALAFAGGGFGPQALGAATAAVWLLVGLPLLWARPERVGGPLALALAALALLAALTALSLQWAADDAAAFEDLVRVLGYLGALTGVGIWCRPGDGPSWLAGVAVAAVGVAVVSVGSRLLGIGSPDADLAATLPAVGGRLSFPLGYWNALGYLAAAALPILIWIAAARAAGDDGAQARPGSAWVPALAVASFVPVALVIHLTSSRGALLAVVAAAAVSIFFAADRRRALLAAAVGGAAALVAVLAAASRDDVLDATAGDLTVSGVAVAAVALAAAAAAAVVFARLRARTTPAPERLRRLARPAIAVAAVALAAVAVSVGPSALIGDFKPAAGEATSDAGGALASGSGRSEFWETALDAFAEDPLRGVGAGGYAAYWTREGDLDVPVANAHSAPLESLAELGVPGGLALLGLAVAVGIGARRLVADPPARPAAGAAAGVAVVGLVAFTLDWTWEMPAAGVPAILAAGLLTGRGLRRRNATGPAADPLRSRSPSDGLGIAVPAALVAVVSVWAGAVIALAAVQLERGEGALADGDLPEAAAAARAAEAIEPWSADPSLLLAEIEQVGGNLDAARRRAERAIRLSPDDFRAWLLLADITASLGEPEASGNYALHAVALAPGALSRRGATLQTGP